MGGCAGLDYRDGPKAIFLDAVRWLCERDVLLPGEAGITSRDAPVTLTVRG